MRFAFIEAEKACRMVTLMCRLLASLAGRVLCLAPAADGGADPPGSDLGGCGRLDIRRAPRPLRQPAGADGTARSGRRSGRKWIARLMRAQGLRARPRRRYRATTDSRHGLLIRPNLLARRFAAAQPNSAWVTDMTYPWTAQGWLCLAVINDLFSHQIVGWSMSERIDRKLALDALRMAPVRRRPAPGLVHHSDRASQYAGRDYQQLLTQHGIRASMSRRGDCWNNAVAESFFASLKIELVCQIQSRTRTQARTAIFEYLELFYNRRRRHSSLGYVSPVEFERRTPQRSSA